jgi:hypothetical protein
VRDFKESNQKYIHYIQQLISTVRSQDFEMTKLRKDHQELIVYKKSLDTYFRGEMMVEQSQKFTYQKRSNDDSLPSNSFKSSTT